MSCAQKSVTALNRRPVVWNEVWSDPSTTKPNGALPGTIIQNWHASSSVDTTAAGFTTLVSTYNEFYLDQQCCMTGNFGPSSGTRLKQCYWTDIATGVPTADLPLLSGGGTCGGSDGAGNTLFFSA